MKRGRPKFEATPIQRNQVTALVACGVPRKQIAEYLHIDSKTLSKAFAREVREATQAANAKIATVLYQKALAGDTVAMLFWLKCRAGWKEGNSLELTGPGGKPAAVNLGIVFPSGGPGHGGNYAIDVSTSAGEEYIEPHEPAAAAASVPRLESPQPKAFREMSVAEQWSRLAESAEVAQAREDAQARALSGDEPAESEASKDARLRTVGRWMW